MSVVYKFSTILRFYEKHITRVICWNPVLQCFHVMLYSITNMTHVDQDMIFVCECGHAYGNGMNVVAALCVIESTQSCGVTLILSLFMSPWHTICICFRRASFVIRVLLSLLMLFVFLVFVFSFCFVLFCFRDYIRIHKLLTQPNMSLV